MSATRQLFGGAFQIDVPASFVDISQFRQVPDNQEVFAEAETDRSIAVELAEAAAVADDAAAAHYFTALARDSDAVASELSCVGRLAVSDLPQWDGGGGTSCVLFARGTMRVAKGRDDATAANSVSVYLLVARLPAVATDVLVTVNAPSEISPHSQAAPNVERLASADDTEAVIERAIKSLAVKSLDIFDT